MNREPMVRVTWRDAAYSEALESYSLHNGNIEEASVPLVVVSSIGWLVYENDEKISLATDMTSDYVRSVKSIPKINILAQQRLRVK